MEKIILDHPLKTADGREIREVHMRRPTVRDMKLAQRAGEGAADHEIAMIALLSEEKLTPEDLEAMDLADYFELQRSFRRLSTRSGGDQANVGAARQVVQVSAERD